MTFHSRGRGLVDIHERNERIFSREREREEGHSRGDDSSRGHASMARSSLHFAATTVGCATWLASIDRIALRRGIELAVEPRAAQVS